jgi:hypothetical protein
MTISPNGQGKKVILSAEIASITRSSYNQLTLSSVDKWYTYQLGSTKANATSTAPSTADRHYVDNSNGSLSVYVDKTATTPKLMLLDVKTGKERQLTQATGITYPVHWLGDNTIVYRVSHGGVVTDNAISAAGGTGKVITNVSDIAGIALWHE